MNNIRDVLLVFDQADISAENAAFQRALNLLDLSGGKLTMMLVIEEPNNLVKDYHDYLSAEELTAMLVNERQSQLEAVANTISNDAIETEIIVTVGHDFIEIIRQMLRGKHDLLIKRTEQSGQNFNSNEFHLMRKCPKPVWLVKERAFSESKRLLAAIDLSMETTQEGKNINRSILALATALAEHEQAELIVLSCWSLYGEETLRHSSFHKIPNTELETLLYEEEQANRQALDDVMSEFSYPKTSSLLLKGDPKDLIAVTALDQAADAIVMGTIGRTGIAGLLIGNTAETVLTQVSASVITLKPSGFETPVRI